MEEELTSTEVSEKVNIMQDQLENVEQTLRRQNDLFNLFQDKLTFISTRCMFERSVSFRQMFSNFCNILLFRTQVLYRRIFVSFKLYEACPQ